jgi:hypothetical protein
MSIWIAHVDKRKRRHLWLIEVCLPALTALVGGAVYLVLHTKTPIIVAVALISSGLACLLAKLASQKREKTPAFGEPAGSDWKDSPACKAGLVLMGSGLTLLLILRFFSR